MVNEYTGKKVVLKDQQGNYLLPYTSPIEVATTEKDGLLSAADKLKLDSLENKNIITFTISGIVNYDSTNNGWIINVAEYVNSDTAYIPLVYLADNGESSGETTIYKYISQSCSYWMANKQIKLYFCRDVDIETLNIKKYLNGPRIELIPINTEKSFVYGRVFGASCIGPNIHNYYGNIYRSYAKEETYSKTETEDLINQASLGIYQKSLPVTANSGVINITLLPE